MIELLVLSPHLDDGVLSCGGALARQARLGGEVRVLTPFAGDDPSSPPSALGHDLARWWKLPVGGIVAARRGEDLAACTALGVVAEHWDLLEAPYRLETGGERPLYPTLSRLFVTADPGEAPLVEQLAARLAALPAAHRVLAPLGAGGHVDHLLVRRAAEAVWGGALELYEDFPYVSWKRLAVWRATRPRRAWREDVMQLTPEELASRCRAVACYRSQLEPMFGGEGPMEHRLRSYVRRVGGERTWRHLDAGLARTAR